MDKRVGHGPPGRDHQKPHERGVVDLADARVRIRSRPKPSNESLLHELDEIRSLLDQGLSTEAKQRLATLISNARNFQSVLALARCALSTALEQQGHYRDSLAAVSMYESPESRAKLDAQTVSYLRVQIGLGYNYNGDHPKAIAMLQATLRDYAETGSVNLGPIYGALSRTYRSISEYPIARDFAQRALESFRQSGEWRGLADSYFGMGLSDMYEGDYESGLDNLEQALKLIGDRPAAHLLGRIYANMAGACWFLKRPQEGIDHLKKAITYYERTDHKTNAADGYNNLGINLILIGQWDRAQEALERALSLAKEVDERGAKVPMILDSLAFANHQTVCVAAGNHGSGTALVTGPATGFNVMAVGALGTDLSDPRYGYVASFSNTGPNDFYNPQTGVTTHGVRAAVSIAAPGTDLILPAYVGATGANGDTMVGEMRLRSLIAQSPDALVTELDSLLGTAWDEALEPYRTGCDGLQASWLSRGWG